MGWTDTRPDLLDALHQALEAGDRDLVVELAWAAWNEPLALYAIDCGVEPHDVGDLLQDVFARILEGWEHFDGRDLRAWLFVVTRFETRTWLTRRRREGRQRSLKWSAALALARESAEAAQRTELVRVLDVVESFDETSRAVFVAAFLYEHTDREAVEYILHKTGMRLSPDAYRWRKSRIRDRVRTLLEGGRNV